MNKRFEKIYQMMCIIHSFLNKDLNNASVKLCCWGLANDELCFQKLSFDI